jgi:hypothetical protein
VANGVLLENDDGVSVSRWNDSKGFNADNGALYGLVKTVTGPQGVTATYRYTNAQGTGVQRSLTVVNSELPYPFTDDRHGYVGPGYILTSGLTAGQGNAFYIHAWTSQGWKQVIAKSSLDDTNPTLLLSSEFSPLAICMSRSVSA